MRNSSKKFISAIFVLISGSQAFAQEALPAAIIVGPSLSIRQTTGNTGGNETSYLTDLKIGYRAPAGVYFGMIYSRQFSNGDNATNQTAIGNTVGFYYGKFSLLTSYFLKAVQTEGPLRRVEGSGFQVDLNVLFPISPELSFGPTLTYKAVNFKKTEGPNNTYLDDNHSETYIYPYITLSLAF